MPTASAQEPGNPQRAYKDFELQLSPTFVQVPYFGRGEIEATIVDLSRDSFSQPGASTGLTGGLTVDSIRFSVEMIGGQKIGWAIAPMDQTFQLYGGEQRTFPLFVSASGAIRDAYVSMNVTATLTLSDGSAVTDSEIVNAQVIPFYQGLVRVKEFPAGYQGLFKTLEVPIEVENTGLYPDSFQLNATAPPGFMVHVPSQIFVPPGESREAILTIVTPKDKVVDFGSPATIFVNMRSTNDQVTVYSTVVGLNTQGVYVPSYWTPIGFLGLVCLGLLVRHRGEVRDLHLMEKGRPRRPHVTPRQQALLKELKRRDPEAHAERVAQLSAIYAARRHEYLSHRKEAQRAEGEARKAARAELREEKKRRKIERKLTKQAERERRKKEAVLRKLRKKRMKQLQKEREKVERLRAKAQKKLDKRNAKEAKRNAKLAARDEKRLARERKRAEKEAKKAAKSAKPASKTKWKP